MMGGTAAGVHRSLPANLEMCSSYTFSEGMHRVLTNDSSLVLRVDAVGESACRDMMMLLYDATSIFNCDVIYFCVMSC